MKIIRAGTFGRRRYKSLAFSGAFADSFGLPELKSRWLIYGGSAQGKTEFCVQLARYLSAFGRVLYVSAEQGDSSSLQAAWLRQGLTDNKKVRLAYDTGFEDMLSYVLRKRGKPKALILDSVDYLNITETDYKRLTAACGGMLLIFTAWAEGRRPKARAAQSIEFMCDIKVRVRDFVAFPRSRYGGNLPFIIWEERAKNHHPFLNRNENRIV